jgi:hypothetical protein
VTKSENIALNHAHISMHKVGAIPFVFGLLLLMPKIGGQEQFF